MVTDTIVIDRVERDGEILSVDPPFILTIRKSIRSTDAMTFIEWEARVDLDDASMAKYSGMTGWFAAGQLTPHVRTRKREDIRGRIVDQIWYWWDYEMWGDHPRRSPETQVLFEELKERIKKL